MKCFTVTEDGAREGIEITTEPYPHVGVGDPGRVYHYRRVAVDSELAGQSDKSMLSRCSVTLNKDKEDIRATGYRLVPENDADGERALVKLEARSAKKGGRTSYDYPRDTFALAREWITGEKGHIVVTSSDLVVLKPGDEVTVSVVEDIRKPASPVLRFGFDGDTLVKA